MMRRQVLSGARRWLSSRRKPERFSSLASALRVFYMQNEHFLVPYTFQVPSDETPKSVDFQWPAETHGLNLGREIRKFVDISRADNSPELLAVRRQLDAVGFPEIHDWKRFQWEQVSLSALKKYKELQGDLLVPRKFVVPEGDQWPRATWGLKLGRHVNFLRQSRQKLIQDQVRDLDDIGFVWVVADYLWSEQFMPALRRYRELYGHCEVPQSFVVGEDGGDEKNEPDKWPERLNAYRLGAVVNRIRAVLSFAEYVDRDRKELDELGFYLYSHDQKWQDTILPAFEAYHRVYGDCNIDTLFIVPEKEPWPPSTWGMRLGFIARNIRYRGDFFRQIAQDFDKLEAIGFVWDVAEAKWKCIVMPALTMYVHVHGDANVPADFVVPSADPWPEASHGLKLGQLANNSARQKRFADCIETDRVKLESLGFSWSKMPLTRTMTTAYVSLPDNE